MKSHWFRVIHPAHSQSARHLNAAGIPALKPLSPFPCLQLRANSSLPGRITVRNALRSLGGCCCRWKVQTCHEFQIVLHIAYCRQHSPRAPQRWAPPQPASDFCDRIRSTNWSVRSAAPFLLASSWLLVLRRRGLNKEAASMQRECVRSLLH